jgi:hypothetical protein
MAPSIEERLLLCINNDDQTKKQSKSAASRKQKMQHPDEEAAYLDAHHSIGGESDDEIEANILGNKSEQGVKDTKVLRESFGSFSEHSELSLGSKGATEKRPRPQSLEDDTSEAPLTKVAVVSRESVSRESFDSFDCCSETSRRDSALRISQTSCDQSSLPLERNTFMEDPPVATENVSSFDDDSGASPSKDAVSSKCTKLNPFSQKVDSDEEWW